MRMIKMRMIRHRLKRKIGLNTVRMGMMRMVLLIMMIISYLVMSILFALLSHHCGYQLSSYLKSKRSSRYRQKCQDLLSEYYQLTWASSSWELRMFATRNIKRSWPFLKLITFKCQLQSEISWSTLLMFLMSFCFIIWQYLFTHHSFHQNNLNSPHSLRKPRWLGDALVATVSQRRRQSRQPVGDDDDNHNDNDNQ